VTITEMFEFQEVSWLTYPLGGEHSAEKILVQVIGIGDDVSDRFQQIRERLAIIIPANTPTN